MLLYLFIASVYKHNGGTHSTHICVCLCIYLPNLFEHEFSESADLLTILRVIHNVVLYEKGLCGDKMHNICYAPTES